MSGTLENRGSVVKFRISSYFAQVTSIVKYFQKITFKVSTAFHFVQNRAKFENKAYRPPSSSGICAK